MLAAILTHQKKPLVIADVEIPKRLAYGQVLVRVHASGICGAQINEIDGVKGEDKFLPHLLGHEGAGVVVDVGPGVTQVSEKDHVVMHWRRGAGIESPTPVYRWGKRTVNAGWVTTFNEYAVVSENRVTKIPKTVDFAVASLFGCAIPTAFGVIDNDAKVKCGESVVVFGAGGVGSAILMAASVAGAYPVVAVDINEYKLKQAKTFGATHVIDGRLGVKKELIHILGKEGADASIETTGKREIRELAYEIAGKNSRTVLVGVPKKGDVMCIDSFPLHFTKKITGSHGGDANPTRDIPRLIRLMESGRFSVESMITKRYSLEKANEAIKDVRGGKVIRGVLDINV